MLIKQGIFLLLCAIFGSAIAAGYVAFITLIGIFEKLSAQSKNAKHIRHIETLIITGVTLSNLVYLLKIEFKLGVIGFSLFNLFGGIFIGCLVGALAETLNIFPILSRRFGVRRLLPYALISAALGKAIGCMIQLLLF